MAPFADLHRLHPASELQYVQQTPSWTHGNYRRLTHYLTIGGGLLFSNSENALSTPFLSSR